jgi:hypothetical protein
MNIIETTTKVPPDHEVHIRPLAFEPSVIPTRAGVIVASFGSAGDDADRELDEVLAGVEREIARGPRNVSVVNVKGPLRVDSMFAPGRPEVGVLQTPISWTFHAGAVASLMASPVRCQRLVAAMTQYAAKQYWQRVITIDDATPAVIALAAKLAELSIGLVQPDTLQGGLTMEIDVVRPDGEVLCAITGRPFPPGSLPSVQPGSRTETPFSYRSPRLLREIDSGVDPNAIVNELAARDQPVFVMSDPSKPGSLEIRKFGDHRAIAVYANATAIQWAAMDVAKPRESYEPEPANLAKLIAIADKDGLGIAIGLYRNRQTPLYMIVPPR